jgi:RNA polymerase sigma factor (TIGR02999 family)
MSHSQPEEPDVQPASQDETEAAAALLAGAQKGDQQCIDRLMELIYPELKRRARQLMLDERTGHTFGPSGSELVNRVIERILTSGSRVYDVVESEEQLIRVLANRMRFILLDYARSRRTRGKPSPRSRVPFDDIQRVVSPSTLDPEQVLVLNDALSRLAEVDPEAAAAVELRTFTGLTNEEAAAGLGWSVARFRRTHRLGLGYLREIMSAPGA